MALQYLAWMTCDTKDGVAMERSRQFLGEAALTMTARSSPPSALASQQGLQRCFFVRCSSTTNLAGMSLGLRTTS